MFNDRAQAGELLASELIKLKIVDKTIVLAIPRGGVVVGAAIAKDLKIPLSVIVVKKLGAPGNSELAIGAVAPDGIGYLDWETVKRLDIGQEYLDEEIERKSREVEERERGYGIRNHESGIMNYTNIILTDDGIATGATTLAAIKWIKHLLVLEPKIILAVPVIAKEAYDRLKSEVDKLIALEIADEFFAVGQFYRNFEQVSDEEVVKILSNLGHL